MSVADDGNMAALLKKVEGPSSSKAKEILSLCRETLIVERETFVSHRHFSDIYIMAYRPDKK